MISSWPKREKSFKMFNWRRSNTVKNLTICLPSIQTKKRRILACRNRNHSATNWTMKLRTYLTRSSPSPTFRSSISNWNSPWVYPGRRTCFSNKRSRPMTTIVWISHHTNFRWFSLRRTKASLASTTIISNKSRPHMSHRTQFCTTFSSTPSSNLIPRWARACSFRAAAKRGCSPSPTTIKTHSSKNSKSWFGSHIGRILHHSSSRKIRWLISRLMQDGAVL